jgi:hypothetical protein
MLIALARSRSKVQSAANAELDSLLIQYRSDLQARGYLA